MIQIRVDWKGANYFAQGMDAVEKTFDKPGHGVSYYRGRPRLPSDRGRPARPYLILGAIRKRTGADPLDPPRELERELLEGLEEVVHDAMERAGTSRHPQRDMIRKALLGAAKNMREDAQERIAKGRTGYHNSPKYARKKAQMLRIPVAHRAPGFQDATSRFGGSRPLVLTGRLYDALTERWYETEPRVPR